MRLYKLELDKNVFKNYLIIIIFKLLYFFVFQGFKNEVCVFFNDGIIFTLWLCKNRE